MLNNLKNMSVTLQKTLLGIIKVDFMVTVESGHISLYMYI